MPETKPNQAAFPLTDGNTFCNEGLTKREYFAAMAMQILVGKIADRNQYGDWTMVAEDSVTIADELIKELNK